MMPENKTAPPTPPGISIQVQFFSYFKDLTGCAGLRETVPAGSTIQDLLRRLHERFPKLEGMRNSCLIAVGMEYQDRKYVLQPGDEISFFPPVQGG
jgi:molybdopterin converting factor small subunit